MSLTNFGPFLTKLRKDRNMTQKELAEKLYVSVSAVSKWERGLCYPEISKMEELSELFEIPVTDLIHCRTGAETAERTKSVPMSSLERGMKADETKMESLDGQTSKQKIPETTFLRHPSKLTEEERREYDREYHRLRKEERARSRWIWGLALIPDTILAVVGFYLWPSIKAWIETYIIPGKKSMVVDIPLSPANQAAISRAEGMFHGPSEIYFILEMIALLLIGAVAIASVLIPEVFWNMGRSRWGLSEEEAPSQYILITRIGGLILWALCVIIFLMIVTMM